MEPHFFRTTGFEKFLVPEDKVQGFDQLCEKMENAKEYSDEWYDLTDEFNDKYWKYKCEGELYSTKLFIESQPEAQAS